MKKDRVSRSAIFDTLETHHTMRSTYLLPLVALTAGSALAAPRSLEQARHIALQTLQNATSRLDIQFTEAQPLHAPQRGAEAVLTPYYIFNAAGGEGYVLISGSDLMPAVIGYSTEGLLPTDADEMPQPMRSWLAYVNDVQQYVEQHPESAPLLEHAYAASEPVAQLLTTVWGQDAPFYDQCPKIGSGQSVTGCMATSIAQVINYQEYPSQFEGYYSYNDFGTTRSMDLSAVSIDYSLLIDNYSRNQGTTEQRAEVAELMHAVGHAINMNYGVESSGAITDLAWQGLLNYLGYTKAVSIRRKYYTLDEWNGLLQNELYNGRPIVFDGQSSDGGHSFVLDGLDSQGYYHVNWGWEGSSNGYYDISILLPPDVGTGASIDTDGFSKSQDAFIYLCRPEEAGPWINPLVSSGTIRCDKSSAILGNTITLSTSLQNISSNAFSGYFGVKVTTADGTLYVKDENSSKQSVSATVIKSANTGYYYSSYGSKDLRRTFTLPTDMPEGEYRIYLTARPDGSEEDDIIRQEQNRVNYWTAIVSGNIVTLTHPMLDLSLDVKAWNFETEQMSTRPSTITATVVNNGTGSVACMPYARFTRPDGQTLSNVAAHEALTLAPGEEKVVSFDVRLTYEGLWGIDVLAQPIGVDDADLQTVGAGQFDVELDPTQGALFALTEAPAIVNDTIWNNELLTFRLKLNNTGASYNGTMSVRLFKNSSSTAESSKVAELTNETVQVAAEASAVEVEIGGILNIEGLKKNTKYYARVYYLCGEEMVEMDAVDGVVNRTAVPVRVARESSGIAEVRVDKPADEDLSSATIYNLLGKQVMLPASGELRPGIYIINGKKRVIR